MRVSWARKMNNVISSFPTSKITDPMEWCDDHGFRLLPDHCLDGTHILLYSRGSQKVAIVKHEDGFDVVTVD